MLPGPNRYRSRGVGISGKQRILVIDDDAKLGEHTRRRVESLGFEAELHHGSFGVTSRVAGGNYALLLLDVNMPGLPGDELYLLLQE